MSSISRNGNQQSFRVKAFLAFVGIFFISMQSFAVMTYLTMTGVSNKDESDLRKPIAYGGFAGTCSGDGTSTCDSCTGAEVDLGGGVKTRLWPCNKTNAYTNLNLVIRASFAATGVTASNAFVKIGDKIISGTLTIEGTGNILNAQIPWGTLCGALSSNGDTSCKTSLDQVITLGIESSASGSTVSETLTVRIISRYVEVGTTVGDEWFYTDCNTTAPTQNFGFCHFEAYQGDEKIYANNLANSEGYPASTKAGIAYSNLIFFYKEYDGTSDLTTIESINNAENLVTLGVNKAADPPVADNRIDGLANDTRYCFMMANQDVTGIISFFTPPPSTGQTTAAELCATPTKVAGLLDDKSCFIATAAFGSQMAPEVQSFREFRNKFLLTSSWGRAFVKLYYKYSPYYANLISENESSKMVVRSVLWPLLFFARLSVAWGFWTTLCVLALVAASLYQVSRCLILVRRKRGEW